MLGPQQTIQGVKWSGPNTQAPTHWPSATWRSRKRSGLRKLLSRHEVLVLQPDSFQVATARNQIGITGTSRWLRKQKTKLERAGDPVPISSHTGTVVWGVAVVSTQANRSGKWPPVGAHAEGKAALLLDMTPVVQSESQFSFAFSIAPSK